MNPAKSDDGPLATLGSVVKMEKALSADGHGQSVPIPVVTGYRFRGESQKPRERKWTENYMKVARLIVLVSVSYS